VLLLIRQMEATATTATAARVSLLCIGQQAIMDAYLCLLHLTTGVCHMHRAGSNHSGPTISPAWPGLGMWLQHAAAGLISCVCAYTCL